MSLFLGPIHHVMYQRVLNQEVLTDKMVQMAEAKGWVSGLEEKLTKTFGRGKDGSLEDIIDESNIHGWLQAQVDRVEIKLDTAVREILAGDSSRIKELQEIWYTYGKMNNVQADNAVDCFNELDSVLLDGMPCSGGRQMMMGDTDEVLWGFDPQMHPLCKPLGDIDNPYSLLRQALIDGMLSTTRMKLEPVGDTEFKIVREG